MFDHGGSLFVVTGLLPATKYKVDFKTTHNAREFHLTTKNNGKIPFTCTKIKLV